MARHVGVQFRVYFAHKPSSLVLRLQCSQWQEDYRLPPLQRLGKMPLAPAWGERDLDPTRLLCCLGLGRTWHPEASLGEGESLDGAIGSPKRSGLAPPGQEAASQPSALEAALGAGPSPPRSTVTRAARRAGSSLAFRRSGKCLCGCNVPGLGANSARKKDVRHKQL